MIVTNASLNQFFCKCTQSNQSHDPLVLIEAQNLTKHLSLLNDQTQMLLEFNLPDCHCKTDVHPDFLADRAEYGC